MDELYIELKFNSDGVIVANSVTFATTFISKKFFSKYDDPVHSLYMKFNDLVKLISHIDYHNKIKLWKSDNQLHINSGLGTIDMNISDDNQVIPIFPPHYESEEEEEVCPHVSIEDKRKIIAKALCNTNHTLCHNQECCSVSEEICSECRQDFCESCFYDHNC